MHMQLMAIEAFLEFGTVKNAQCTYFSQSIYEIKKLLCSHDILAKKN